MKYRLPKASTQFIHTPSVCGLLWFGCFGDFRIHHTALYPLPAHLSVPASCRPTIYQPYNSNKPMHTPIATTRTSLSRF